MLPAPARLTFRTMQIPVLETPEALQLAFHVRRHLGIRWRQALAQFGADPPQNGSQRDLWHTSITRAKACGLLRRNTYCLKANG